MKPNLVKRVATAVAFAGIAVLVSACGSSNNNAVGPGIGGPAFSNGLGSTGAGTQAVAFSGVAAVDPSTGNIYAGQNVGPLTLQATGMVQPGGYQFGRINSQDGSTLEFNISGSYGSQVSIQGVYLMGQEVLGILGGNPGAVGYGGMGASYPGYGYGMGGGISSLSLNAMGTEPMAQAASVIGNQPFTYAIVSGELILNGSINAPY